MRKFLKILLITLLIGVFSTAALLFGYLYVREGDVKRVAKQIGSGLTNKPGLFASVPTRTNFVIMGTDADDTRTDVIMLGCFQSEDQKITLISIPRDTYTVMPGERRDLLKQNNRQTPASGAMKINAVYHYAGPEWGASFLVKQLEEMFGISIQYYVKIDLEAFRYIVDEIGGVEFDVPQALYYQDPVQGLSIDIKPGLQVLDGAAAEGLVRFRKSSNTQISQSYPESDLRRVQMQQAFLKAMITQVLNPARSDALRNASVLAQAAIQYVETNFDAADIAKYLKYIQGINSDSIETYTIPCHNDDPYVIIDEGESRILIDRVFYSKEISAKDADITVLNGTHTSGHAAKNRDMLTGMGYHVTAIGDHTGEKAAETIIRVKYAEHGEELLPLFPNSRVELDPGLGTDIIIILGLDSVHSVSD